MLDKPKILIVDDEASVHYAFNKILGSEYLLIFAKTQREALQIIENETPDLILLDLKLPDGNGLDILKIVRSIKPYIPIIVITAYADTDSAISAIKEGAFDYISKPFEINYFKQLIKKALAHFYISRDERINTQDTNNQNRNCKTKIVGKSKAILEVSKLIGQVAPTDVPVLILGESGVGKELVARAIHYNSKRKDKPFIVINCASIPDTLVESELFGYEAGAFTSAQKRKLGKLEIAQGGTLFLDEIGDMSLTTQAKILRVLQDKTFERLGGNKSIQVDVRIIAATNKNLSELIKEGHFRADLYHRLNVVTIFIPPLRERKEDIPLLVDYFIYKANNEFNTNIKGITEEALQSLINYSFPGNVRELENLVTRAVILSKGPYITLDDLNLFILNTKEGLNSQIDSLIEELIEKTFKMDATEIYYNLLKKLEKALITKALEITKGNQLKASYLLGINRLTLRKKIEEYQINLFKK